MLRVRKLWGVSEYKRERVFIENYRKNMAEMGVAVADRILMEKKILHTRNGIDLEKKLFSLDIFFA